MTTTAKNLVSGRQIEEAWKVLDDALNGKVDGIEYAYGDSFPMEKLIEAVAPMLAQAGDSVGKRQLSPQDDAIGAWLTAALSDSSVCDEMKRDINNWMDQFEFPRSLDDRLVSSPVETKIVASTNASKDGNKDDGKVARDAYEKGWRAASRWANRDDLICDIESPSYIREMQEAINEAAGMIDHWFVILNTQNGGLAALVDGEGELAVFTDVKLAREAAQDNILGSHFGYQIFCDGEGLP